MAGCFGVNFYVSGVDYKEMFFGMFVPTMTQDSYIPAIGIIGCIIMPHNLHLHSALVLSRKVDPKNSKAVYESNIYNTLESGIALLIAFIINLFVIGTFANYMRQPDADPSIDLHNADAALRDSFGTAAKYIWGIGLLAAG